MSGSAFWGIPHCIRTVSYTHLDVYKRQDELGWQPSLQFEEGIEKTVRWYLQNQKWMDDITSSEYEKYYQSMYKER